MFCEVKVYESFSLTVQDSNISTLTYWWLWISSFFLCFLSLGFHSCKIRLPPKRISGITDNVCKVRSSRAWHIVGTKVVLLLILYILSLEPGERVSVFIFIILKRLRSYYFYNSVLQSDANSFYWHYMKHLLSPWSMSFIL